MKPRLKHLAFASLLLLAACGGKEEPAAAKAPVKAKPAAADASASAPAATNAIVAANSFKAVFSTNLTKDPFYPRSKPKEVDKPKTVAGAPPSGAAVQTALQAGFKGIYGTASERIAIVHGIALQEGRNVEIPVTLENQPKRLKAKVVRVTRTVVELQVEGVPQVVVLTLQAR